MPVRWNTNGGKWADDDRLPKDSPPRIGPDETGWIYASDDSLARVQEAAKRRDHMHRSVRDVFVPTRKTAMPDSSGIIPGVPRTDSVAERKLGKESLEWHGGTKPSLVLRFTKISRTGFRCTAGIVRLDVDVLDRKWTHFRATMYIMGHGGSWVYITRTYMQDPHRPVREIESRIVRELLAKPSLFQDNGWHGLDHVFGGIAIVFPGDPPAQKPKRRRQFDKIDRLMWNWLPESVGIHYLLIPAPRPQRKPEARIELSPIRESNFSLAAIANESLDDFARAENEKRREIREFWEKIPESKPFTRS
jgi:hypothetical protein